MHRAGDARRADAVGARRVLDARDLVDAREQVRVAGGRNAVGRPWAIVSE